MLDAKTINELVEKVIDSLPDAVKSLPGDCKENMRAGLMSVFF